MGTIHECGDSLSIIAATHNGWEVRQGVDRRKETVRSKQEAKKRRNE
jgi:hypothetical protein